MKNPKVSVSFGDLSSLFIKVDEDKHHKNTYDDFIANLQAKTHLLDDLEHGRTVIG